MTSFMLKSPSIVARVLDLARITLSMTFNRHAPNLMHLSLKPSVHGRSYPSSHLELCAKFNILFCSVSVVC